MDFRRLLPEPGTVTVEELLESLRLDQRAPAERPYVIVNFVASVDGRATFQGRSGPLGDEGDHAIFHGLREQVDAVLAGTVTLRTERYGRILGSEERRERRRERGRSAEPLACMITRSGEIDTGIPLFAETEARVVIFAAHPLETGELAARVEVVQLDLSELTVTTALRRLREDYGVASLLCEGGPTLFGAMLQEGVVDELFLTLGPELVGGGAGPTISSGPELSEPAALEPIWLLARNGSLYARYRLRPSDGAGDRS